MNNTNHIHDFDRLIRAFISIGNKMEGIKIVKGDEFLYNAEGLGKKILNHIITSRLLLNGYELENFHPQIDFASIAVLTRAALETYLALNYLFVSPESADEKEFKLQAWYLGGLDRIKHEPAFDDNKEKCEKEFQQASEIRLKIEATDFYKGLKLPNQEKILKGDWKYGGWSLLGGVLFKYNK